MFFPRRWGRRGSCRPSINDVNKVLSDFCQDPTLSCLSPLATNSLIRVCVVKRRLWMAPFVLFQSAEETIVLVSWASARKRIITQNSSLSCKTALFSKTTQWHERAPKTTHIALLSTKQPQDSSKLQKCLLLKLWQLELTEAARKKADTKSKKNKSWIQIS